MSEKPQEKWAGYDPTKPGAIPPAGEESRAPDRAFLEYQPKPKPELPHVWEYPENDDGRAAFFLAHFEEIVRFCPELNQWRVWHGHRWHPDTTGRVGNYAQILSRSELDAAQAEKEKMAKAFDEYAATPQTYDILEPPPGDPPPDKNAQDKIFKSMRRRATALGNEGTIAAMLDAAARWPSVIVPMEQWDAHPYLIGVRNGTLDLRTRKRRDGHQSDLITKTLAVELDPAATCPKWEKFIARILPDERAEYVRRVVGYSLTGNTDDHAFYLCYGRGKNGKSIMIKTLAWFFGDYAGHARADLIEEPRNGASPKHDLANLPGVRFLYSEETSDGTKFRSGTVKSIASGEPLTGEAKYCSPFKFVPVAKLWIGGNHRPDMDPGDEGFERRVRLIPFDQQITDEEEIPTAELLANHQAEGPGILNWALPGLAGWRPGLRFAPIQVRAATSEYRDSEDELKDFISRCTKDAPIGHPGVKKQLLYRTYTRWAEAQGNKRPFPAKSLTRRLKDKGWELDAGSRYWRGKSILPDKDWA